MTDNPSAEHHRKSSVEKLELLEAEYAKETVDYGEAEKLMTAIDKSLASIHKLEPNVDAAKFDERYSTTKNTTFN